jgi:hypothetical protein
MVIHTFEPEKYAGSVEKLFEQVITIESARETIYRQNRTTDIMEQNISDFDNVETLYDEILNQLCRAICSEILINTECTDNKVSAFFHGIRATVVLVDETDLRIAESSYIKRTQEQSCDGSITVGIFPDEYIRDKYDKRIPRRWM